LWPSSQTLSTVESARESPQIKPPEAIDVALLAGSGRA